MAAWCGVRDEQAFAHPTDVQPATHMFHDLRLARNELELVGPDREMLPLGGGKQRAEQRA
jgi:hypothetical protein